MASFFKTMPFKTPGKADCELCIEKVAGILDRRQWKDVKNFVYNMNNTEKNRAKKMSKQKN